MTDKLYTQSEVTERERLAQAAALKEAARQLCAYCSRGNIRQVHNGEWSHWVENEDRWNSCETQDILALCDQPLLAQRNDAELREDRIDRLAAKLSSVQEDYLRLYTKFHKQADALKERERQLMQDMHDDLENCLREGKDPVLLLVVWRNALAALRSEPWEKPK